MIARLDPSSQILLDSINATQRDLNKAQNQVSSGLRITRASDDPQAIADLLAARSDLAQVTQVDNNLTKVQGEVQTADGVIQNAVQLLENAGVLATQGATGTSTAAQRTILANQVDSILQQIVGISRTQANGEYIFSGDQTQTPPYQIDPSSPTGVQQLVTSPATRLIQDPSGLTFAVSKTAQELFDARDGSNNVTTGNVFAALNDLKTALAANNTSGIQAAATEVNAALDYLNPQAGFYGAVENRVTTALDLAKKFETQDQAQIGSAQDADIAAAALQMTQDTTHLNAALASAAKQPTTSLFDYMH
jgi:flagellar hook-associated protein 3 FlgL